MTNDLSSLLLHYFVAFAPSFFDFIRPKAEIIVAHDASNRETVTQGLCECGGGYIYNQLDLGRDGKLHLYVDGTVVRDRVERERKRGKIAALFVVIQSNILNVSIVKETVTR